MSRLIDSATSTSTPIPISAPTSTTIPTPTSSSPSEAAPTRKAKPLSRDGIRGGKRADKEPLVYRELPSFPSFEQAIPNEASIEEICIYYPNHLRGSYFDAFIQWHWSAGDIYNRLTEQAISEFRDNGITTCKVYANRANFLFKRLDSYLRGLDAETVTALCTAPKLRGCMMDGTERYGASKLQGKFANPKAQPVRRFPARQQRQAQEPATAAHLDPTYQALLSPQSTESLLWEATEPPLDEYKSLMADQWRRQRRCAETIVSADAFFSQSDSRQRAHSVLQMLKWPVTRDTESFFAFESVEQCPAFVKLIDDKVTAIVDSFVSARTRTAETLSAMPNNIDPQEQLALDRQYAVSLSLAEQRATSSRLQQLALSAGKALEDGRKRFGLVHQAIQAVASSAGESVEEALSTPERSSGSAELLRGSSHNPTLTDMWVSTRVRQERHGERVSYKRLQFDGAGPGPEPSQCHQIEMSANVGPESFYFPQPTSSCTGTAPANSLAGSLFFESQHGQAASNDQGYGYAYSDGLDGVGAEFGETLDDGEDDFLALRTQLEMFNSTAIPTGVAETLSATDGEMVGDEMNFAPESTP